MLWKCTVLSAECQPAPQGTHKSKAAYKGDYFSFYFNGVFRSEPNYLPASIYSLTIEIAALDFEFCEPVEWKILKVFYTGFVCSI